MRDVVVDTGASPAVRSVHARWDGGRQRKAVAAIQHRELRIQHGLPFAFDLALEYLRASPSSIVEVVDSNTYRRAIRLESSGPARHALLAVRRAGPASLAVTLSGSAIETGDLATIATLVRRLFAVEDDLTPLQNIARDDPIFGALVRAYDGLRPIIIPELFETIIWAILGQQVNVAFAAKTKRALVDRFGENARIGDDDYRLFPRPERLAIASEHELREIQLSRQKIRYVLGVARDVAEGRLDLERLARLAPEEALARLESVLGVGRWTAEYVLMRGLGHRDVIPAADGGLRRIIGERYGLGRSASEDEVRELAQRWVGWRSYAAFYWWFTLQRGKGAPET
jgi:DNA-3-methyladenine glycosylase II